MPRHSPSRYAAALDYLERLKSQATEFGGGVVDTLGNRARDVGGLAYEALTSDPNMGRMTTAEFSEAASRPTPRLDQTAQDFGTISKAIVTQPIQTGKAIVQGEIDRAQEATTSPRAAGEYAGSFIDPMRIAAALRKTAPIAELDVYHGTPHRFDPTEENPLGEFDASKIGTGEGAQAYGHGVYLAEDPKIAAEYSKRLWANKNYLGHPEINAAEKKASNASNAWFQSVIDGAPTETKAKLKAVYETADAELKTTKSQYGKQMYKADLPDKMIDKMLDWDEPIGAGKENLLVEIAKNPKLDVKQYEELLGLTPTSVNQQETGEMLYKALREDLGSDTEASAVFQQAGFPGVKYLDALAKKRRSDVDWTDKKDKRNFVVFPGEEKKVRILERDGQKAPPQKIAQALEAAPDYRMGHRPMTVEGGAARLDNAYEAFGEDIYGPNALRYFGGSDPRESGTVAALKRLRNNPDAEVTIYRGVPTDAKGGITKGDWVTLDKSAAQEYAELKPGQKGKVLAMKVKAKDVTTWPDSLLEFGYYPAD